MHNKPICKSLTLILQIINYCLQYGNYAKHLTAIYYNYHNYVYYDHKGLPQKVGSLDYNAISSELNIF